MSSLQNQQQCQCPPKCPSPKCPPSAPHRVCVQPPQAVLPAPRMASAWAPTGATGPTDAGTRAGTPVLVTVVCSPGALAVARALRPVADLGHEIK
ncbi:late cornified envelope protein 3D-like [Moschus berezovskii]|uniref:late cornified envelope protein 3D-like n=1 Tax=Moschus berezovskii TaxID=68408 RepID=UPI00244447CD|nr:late cornified envelope protein 3D-like [Moschus berezovskii]